MSRRYEETGMLNSPEACTFTCVACGNVELDSDSYQKGNALLCPHCFVRGLPKAIMSLDESLSGKVTATVDAWHAGKAEADAYCEERGWKITHCISDEAAKELEAECNALTAQRGNVGKDLWNLFAK